MRALGLLIAVLSALVAWPSSAAGGAGWVRPVDGYVLRPFAVGPDRYAAGQHRGVDLAAAAGTRVRAACGGRVSFAGRVPRGGLTVSVLCGRLVATYQHLRRAVVGRGDVVIPGAPLGAVAAGVRPRPHVHLGARERATGAYVDPLSLLQEAPRAVPPPLPVTRRPLPLGPAPVARVPVRVGRAPARVTVRPREVPVAWQPPTAAADRLPWPVWLGLAFVGVGLPLGGLVRVRSRRRRALVPVAQTMS